MSSRFVVHGGIPLEGRIEASGSKNACLPIMAASILADDVVELSRVPDISDVRVMAEIMRSIGVSVNYDKDAGTMSIDSRLLKTTCPPEDLVARMNASFDVAGPLLARCGKAEVSLPGGCRLGPRPVNFHIEAFRQLGAEVEMVGGFVKSKAAKLKGAHIIFPMVSVGATKNAMMAATLAEGTTILEGCAREPEIADLANFCNKMGARISGIGTQTLRIEGVPRLHGTSHRVMSDRIEGSTYLLAAAITNGDITVEDLDPQNVGALLAQLQKAGQDVEIKGSSIRVRGHRPILPVEVYTSPFPGFPTDLHPPLVSLLALGDGVSSLGEMIFGGRFMYVMELARLGADILAVGKTLRIRGVKELVGAPVDAPDIRAGGALVLAGLAASGETTIRGVRYIDRGYQKLVERFSSLGADIKRVHEPLRELE